MSANLPDVASPRSIKVQVETGKIYLWCACGLSANQPFCDGAHKGSGFAPIRYIADEDKMVGFCGCKHSKLAPMCDGSHKQLVENS